jgi:hypothetical protein
MRVMLATSMQRPGGNNVFRLDGIPRKDNNCHVFILSVKCRQSWTALIERRQLSLYLPIASVDSSTWQSNPIPVAASGQNLTCPAHFPYQEPIQSMRIAMKSWQLAWHLVSSCSPTTFTSTRTPHLLQKQVMHVKVRYPSAVAFQ